MAVVLGPNGTRLDLRLSDPGFDWGGWSTDLAQRGVRGVTTDDDPVYGPALRASGLDRQQCTVGRHIRSIDKDARPTWTGNDYRRRGPSCRHSGRR